MNVSDDAKIKELEKILLVDDVEFCHMETGEYTRAIGVTVESGRRVVMLERVKELE